MICLNRNRAWGEKTTGLGDPSLPLQEHNEFWGVCCCGRWGR